MSVLVHCVRASGPAVSPLRSRYEQRNERLTALRHVQNALVNLAGLVGRPMQDQTGAEIGSVVDVVARWDGRMPHPPVTNLIVKVGRRRGWPPIGAVEDLRHDLVGLRSAQPDLRDFIRRHGEVELARDVVDHQLVDTYGAQLVRASDLYLARVADIVQLVRVDVGFASLLRRLAPARLRTKPTPEKVIDSAGITSFGSQRGPRGTLQAS